MIKRPIAFSLMVAGAVLLFGTRTVRAAAEATAATPGPAPTATAVIKQAFAEGDLDVNLRMRWEHVEQDGLDNADAVTFRARLGYTIAPIYGFQAGLEFEGNIPVGTENQYRPYPGSTDPDTLGKAIIADPEDYEVNQAWLGYNRWDSKVRGGRQLISLDNQRFVGPVGWRQLNQTYDAAMVNVGALRDFNFFYGYLWKINRVVGQHNPGGQWDSASHLINVSYDGCEYAKVVGYAYLLDITSAPAASSDTVGASVSGKYPLCESWKLGYRAEFAWQWDAADNPASYNAPYYHVSVGPEVSRYNFGAAYEVLGANSGGSVQTPLATLHAFNGAADVFLATPADGLRDAYAWVGVKLPGDVPVTVTGHKFDADRGSNDYGWEADIAVARSFGKHFKVLAKYAWYDGKDGGPAYSADRSKFWLQGEFVY